MYDEDVYNAVVWLIIAFAVLLIVIFLGTLFGVIHW